MANNEKDERQTAPSEPKSDRSLAASSPAQKSAPASRRPPNLDAVFLDEDEVEPEDEASSEHAAGALGMPTLLDLESAGDPKALESSPGSHPSSTRLSAPPGAAVHVRAAVSAPPMSVPSLRPPTAAPPPFAPGSPAMPSFSERLPKDGSEVDDLSDDLTSEPDFTTPDSVFTSSASPSADPPSAGHDLFHDLDSRSEQETIADADLASDEFDERRPANESANVLRANVPPWERSAHSDSLKGLLSGPRSGGSIPPPPPSVAPKRASIPPSTRPASAPPPAPPSSPQLDPHRAPKTLVSAPPRVQPLSLAPEPAIPAEKPRRGVLFFVLVLIGLGAAAGFWFFEKYQPGGLVVTISGPGNQPLSGVKLYLDGQLVCRKSPCKLSGLNAGTHLVHAEAEGHTATADEAVVVEAGKEAVHNIALQRAGPATRVAISTQHPGFEVKINGKEYGATPVEITDLEPGNHSIEVYRDGFETLREQVHIELGETHRLGPLSPKLLKGKLEVKMSSNSIGTTAWLDGERIEIPTTLELDAAKRYQLTASQKGFLPFKREIRFAAESPIVAIDIELEPADDADSATGTNRAVREAAPSSKVGEANEEPAKGQATLSFNSIPASTVVLDGRPIGETPRVGIKVSPGRHTVVFVHPERGRKTVDVTIDAGATRAVSVRF